MSVPDWYELILLALASWRVYRFIGEDTILDKPRDYVTKRSEYIETLLECPYCAGTYIVLAWWGAWQLWAHETLVVASVVSAMALVPLIERLASDE